ncbi:hypothetical protein V2A60_002124 [Cordyceps javanica]
MWPNTAPKRPKFAWAAVIICFVLYFQLEAVTRSGSDVTSPSASSSEQQPTRRHPVSQLVRTAQQQFDKLKRKQSKSLPAAVAEYRRRYGMHPPPHFDKWYKFATDNRLVLIDEFDTIHQSMTPFWGLAPAAVRKRTSEALHSGEHLMRVTVRDGNVTGTEGGPEWHQDALRGMMQKFAQYLPDMEIAFDTVDEPRVVVPHADLARLVSTALRKSIPAAGANKRPINSFSRETASRQENAGPKMANVSFAPLGRESSWQHLRQACSPNSPSRALQEADFQDDVESYGLGSLGFIYNTTAMSDVCLSPSLSSSHGFFDRPDTHSVSHDLVPIFSQSKVSSNSDILYPSPWYWAEVVKYDAASDRPWAEKRDRLYWRGSTTGGYGSDGNWKGHHRQRFVHMLNSDESAATILSRRGDKTRAWKTETVRHSDYRDLVDVAFTRTVQCDEAACESQQRYFDIQEHASQQDGWGYKFVLDMDGNAFSGRFHALLRSASLTFKFAVFREWHSEWLKPWVHYVPLSLQGREWLELVRYFSDGGDSGTQAADMAAQSSDWASMTLRNEDMEAWLFRLLLE